MRLNAHPGGVLVLIRIARSLYVSAGYQISVLMMPHITTADKQRRRKRAGVVFTRLALRARLDRS